MGKIITSDFGKVWYGKNEGAKWTDLNINQLNGLLYYATKAKDRYLIDFIKAVKNDFRYRNFNTTGTLLKFRLSVPNKSGKTYLNDSKAVLEKIVVKLIKKSKTAKVLTKYPVLLYDETKGEFLQMSVHVATKSEKQQRVFWINNGIPVEEIEKGGT